MKAEELFEVCGFPAVKTGNVSRFYVRIPKDGATRREHRYRGRSWPGACSVLDPDTTAREGGVLLKASMAGPINNSERCHDETV